MLKSLFVKIVNARLLNKFGINEMKKAVLNLQYVFLLVLLMMAGHLASAEVQSKIDNFELASCSQESKKCIQVHAVKAQSGSVSPSLALKNITVEVKTDKNKMIKKYQSENGFYDLETNRIILSKLVNKDTLKETVIYMKSLEIKHMEMR